MKYRLIFILSAIFLILLYTCMLWIESIGFAGFLLTAIVLWISFLGLVLCFLWHLAFGIKEKFKSKNRNTVIIVLMLVLTIAYFQPFGLLTSDRFDGRDLLVAEREGSANCTIVFKLKENNQFVERKTCFGIENTEGEYYLRNDTIYFQNVKSGDGEAYYQFAVIKADEYDLKPGTLIRYKHRNDSMKSILWISKNDLN